MKELVTMAARTPSPFAIAFVELMNDKHTDYIFTIEGLNKMDRIVIKSRKYSGASVHAFICKTTGGVYKAAGYKAPAKGVRFTSLFDAADASDPHGGYLYK
jgi:hypothetical protein